MHDARRARLGAVLATAMKRVDTRARVPGRRAPSSTNTLVSLVVPQSDFIALRARADDLTLGGSSEHAATLTAAMRERADVPVD